jgi:ABC-2 type transport system ATP-binding protein
MEEAIKAENLTRSYDGNVVVDGVDLDVREGQILGFVGPNGAGKTTTWSMLTGVLKPTRGTVSLLGRPVDVNDTELKRQLGIVPDHSVMFESLTGEELLLSYARIYGLGREDAGQRTDEALAVFDLEDAARRPITTYSHGMRKKIRLAAATLHAPRVLFLDEPFEGMDALSARTVMSILQQMAEQDGVAVFLTSHMLDYVERVSSHIAVIRDGKVLLSCSRKEFRELPGAEGEDGAGRLENLILSISRRERFSRLSWIGNRSKK